MCGAKASKTALYCSKCGNKLEGVSEASSSTLATAPEESPGSKNYIYQDSSSPFFEKKDAKASLSGEVEKRKRNITTIVVAVISVLVIASFAMSAGGSSSNDLSSSDSSITDETSTDDITENQVPVDWAPSGYTQWDDFLAYKWVTESHSSDCSDCTYWFIEVVSHYGCPGGVYAEINMLDGESVVDWSNDSIPSLGSENSALLEFVHYPYESQLQGELTNLSCNT
jgi:hypothetical protein